MRDVEVLLRYFAFQYTLEDYTGNLKKFLDDTVNYLNGAWDAAKDEIEERGRACESAIEMTFRIFGEDSFYRWANGKYEGRFNRAVFDIMTYYFTDPAVQAVAIEKKDEIRLAFQELCTTNRLFVESIQTTTKTLSATHRRLSLWGEKLASILERPLPIPSLSSNRITV